MRAIVKVNIESEFEVSDGGYLGDTNSSIKEHIQAAIDHLHGCKVTIERGGIERKAKHHKIVLKEVVLVPDE